MVIEQDNFSRLDSAFAGFMVRHARSKLESVDAGKLHDLMATLSQQLQQGHSCFEISEADKNLLIKSGLTLNDTEQAAQSCPLVVEKNRLYLQRYWHYETRLAQQLKRFSADSVSSAKLENLLTRHFGITDSKPDLQRNAARLACSLNLCIITGGPGTGKTTTVCKILAILQELAASPLNIALAAPTGKAAMRLQETVASNLAGLDCPDNIKEIIPKSAFTLHRLLGARPPTPYFRHHSEQPLAYDAVVVDEASMVDLALMSKLVDALKPGSRLILLGDKDQLASVETGSVLADLITALPGNTVELTETYRFDNRIKQLADAVNRQDQTSAWTLLSDRQQNEVIGLIEQNRLILYIASQRQDYLNLLKDNAGFSEIYKAFSRFHVLCANRHGYNGALQINHLLERELFANKIIHPGNPWFPGRPVMVVQNHPALHLFNGDIGICLPDADNNGVLSVFFQRPDGSIRKFLPSRMPACETVFAMTIHKSQGSEFDEVVIVLPETPNPVLSKELLYTAISRAKKRILLAATENILNITVARKLTRASGLADKLSANKENS
jgi:exodeoxyribonuclease V alpha subunit